MIIYQMQPSNVWVQYIEPISMWIGLKGTWKETKFESISSLHFFSPQATCYVLYSISDVREHILWTQMTSGQTLHLGFWMKDICKEKKLMETKVLKSY